MDAGHEERQAGASCFCGPHISASSPTSLPLPGPAPEPGGPALLGTVLKLYRCVLAGQALGGLPCADGHRILVCAAHVGFLEEGAWLR